MKYFLTLGIAERNKVHTKQIEKQRREDMERQKELEAKLHEAANRSSYTPDMNFTEPDIKSIQEKVSIAAEKFDKSHPAAPSLEAFDAAHMAPGNFRENIKSIFGIKATPKEIGYLLSQYDKEKNGKINTKDFLIKFFQLGKKIRDSKRRVSLEKQRAAEKQMSLENEAKLIQLLEKSDYQADDTYEEEDFTSAEEKMRGASEKYDKTHPAAPNLDGFTGGPISPGVFRELMKNAFKVYFTPKEIGALLEKFHIDGNFDMFDGKKYLIHFMRLGFDARARRKTEILRQQRASELSNQQLQEQKLQQALARVDIDLDSTTYSDGDKERAMQKLISAAALYDKNAPGSASLDSLNALYLTPGNFRETMKRTFNIIFTPSELAAMVAEFNNGQGNIDTSRFLVCFVRWGSEEREKQKLLQIEKQRKENLIRETIAEQKEQQKSKKLLLSINYEYTQEQREKAFEKLAIAAKKYDKAHPAAMTLDGFEEKHLKPHVFREMLKRTFNLNLSPEELGAIIHYFDKNNTGEIISQDFLIHFLKVGIAERDKEHKDSLRKLREDAEFREKYHQDKMAAQWRKAELDVTYDFSFEERESAMEKLTEASVKFDPNSAGPMGLTAFQASVLSPAVFREMLRRVFRMKLTNGELAALIKEFDKDDTKHIHCQEFLVKFQSLGTERKNEFRLKQIAKQRELIHAYEEDMKSRKQALDTKLEITLDHTFSEEDFQSVLEKIRILAKNYDRSHPSAPSLKGFMGADMKPNEFKDMLMRTFHTPLTVRELSALIAFFPGGNSDVATSSSTKSISGDASTSAKTNRSVSPGVTTDLQPRINNRDFLTYFNKLNREEFTKRNTARILKEKQLKEEEQKRLQDLESEKFQELLSKILYQAPQDQLSFAEKVIEAAKEYATDSAPYITLLQGFKGPALPPDKFREIFYQIFGIKFSMPEIGVLVDVLQFPKETFVVLDGSTFLNWFYKVSRLAEAELLQEEGAKPVTWDIMRSIDLKAKAPQRTVSPRSISSKHDKIKKMSTYSAGDFRPRSSFDNSTSSLGSNTVGAFSNKPTTAASKNGKNSGVDDYGDANTVATQTDKKKSSAAKKQEIEAENSRSDTKPSTAAQSISGSRSQKRYKGFGSISWEAHGSRDSQDLSSFMSDTLDRSWFLPSLLGAGSNDYSLQHLNYQQDLQEIFSRSEVSQSALPFEDDHSMLTMESTFLDKLNLGGNRSFDVGSSSSRNRTNRTKTSKNSNRRLVSKSTPNFLVPNMAYASLGSTISTSSGVKRESDITASEDKGEHQESDFLKVVFGNNSTEEIKIPARIKIPGQLDPVARMKQVSTQIRDSPMAQVAALQQENKSMNHKRRKTPPGNNLAPLFSGAAGPSPTKPVANNNTNSSNDKGSTKNAGGFFFPVLLSGGDDPSNTGGTVPSVNIGIVGESEAHPEYLQKLLSS